MTASAWPFAGLRPVHYGAILADPPWRFSARSDKGQGRAPERHYPTMTLADIKALPVQLLAAEHCALFLWVCDPLLPQGLEVMRAWGFTFKTVAFTWAKRTRRDSGWHAGLGYWTRGNPETCLLGTIGAPARQARDVRQLIVAPLREHSRKPEEVRDGVERLVPGPYCELFARSARPGWHAWGNQVGRFAA
jgi:N6-adenosine-specific RNA methylase IME4